MNKYRTLLETIKKAKDCLHWKCQDTGQEQIPTTDYGGED